MRSIGFTKAGIMWGNVNISCVAVQEVGILLRKYIMFRCVALNSQNVGIMRGKVNTSYVAVQDVEILLRKYIMLS